MWIETLSPRQHALVDTILSAMGDTTRGNAPHLRANGLAWGSSHRANAYFISLLNRVSTGLFDDVPPHNWSEVADQLLATLAN